MKEATGCLSLRPSGTSPAAALANESLGKAIATLHEGEHPILRSADNARLAKGSRWRMKQEMFCGRDWSGVSLDEFMKAIGGCLVWLCSGRIKTAPGNKTPMEHRQSLGLAA